MKHGSDLAKYGIILHYRVPGQCDDDRARAGNANPIHDHSMFWPENGKFVRSSKRGVYSARACSAVRKELPYKTFERRSVFPTSRCCVTPLRRIRVAVCRIC
jgi:hypothetical protein